VLATHNNNTGQPSLPPLFLIIIPIKKKLFKLKSSNSKVQKEPDMLIKPQVHSNQQAIPSVSDVI
jgi:hypothetical protein